MPQLTGDQLIGDVFKADQGTAGAAGPNPNGSYLYQATTTLSQYGGEIVVTAGSGEMLTGKVVGGSHDGQVFTGTIVANDASDILVQTDLAFVYITNDPAAQPTPPADPNGPPGPDSSRTVGALGSNNTYTYQAPECFVTGTQIRTTLGECAVEDLVVGDVVVTATGETRPIVWIGHRDTDCRGRPETHPVRVAAHAFGEDLPARDLMLSPGHPVLVGADADNGGGHLVPIMCLVNGTSVRHVAVDAIIYWHVELDAHGILLAEGLPLESYLDSGDRAFFTEGSDHALHNPDFIMPGLAGRCRPVALDGPVVKAAQRHLDAVFAAQLVTACNWPGAEDPMLWS